MRDRYLYILQAKCCVAFGAVMHLAITVDSHFQSWLSCREHYFGLVLGGYGSVYGLETFGAIDDTAQHFGNAVRVGIPVSIVSLRSSGSACIVARATKTDIDKTAEGVAALDSNCCQLVSFPLVGDIAVSMAAVLVQFVVDTDVVVGRQRHSVVDHLIETDDESVANQHSDVVGIGCDIADGVHFGLQPVNPKVTVLEIHAVVDP